MALSDEHGDRLPTLRRAVSVLLEFATASKRRRLAALEAAFRGDVRRFVGHYWEGPGARLDKAALEAVSPGSLGAWLHSQAQKVALPLVAATRKAEAATGKKASRPRYEGGLKLSGAGRVEVALRDGEPLDLLVSVPSLKKGRKIRIPTKATAVLRKWLALPGARLSNFVEVAGDRLTLVVEAPRPAKRERGEVLGVDVGFRNLLATSRGEFLGTDFAAVAAKVRRRKPGSKGRRRALRERDQYVNRQLNLLPWAPDPGVVDADDGPWPGVRALALEDLSGIKTGKKAGRGRAFRRKVAPWVAAKVRERAGQKAEEHGAWLLDVEPRGNSQTCPSCGRRDPESRRGPDFVCTGCERVDDSDHVGAVNAGLRGRAKLGLEVEDAERRRLASEAGREERAARRAANSKARLAKVAATRAAKKATKKATKKAAKEEPSRKNTAPTPGPSRPGDAARATKTSRGAVPRRDAVPAKAPVAEGCTTASAKAVDVRRGAPAGTGEPPRRAARPRSLRSLGPLGHDPHRGS